MGRFFLDPKTKEIYTPNTDKTTSFGGGNAPKKPLDNSADGGIIEERGEDRSTRGTDGKFTGSHSIGASSGSSGGGLKAGKSKEEQKIAIQEAFKRCMNDKTSKELVNTVIENHYGLGEFTAQSMKSFLEECGYNVRPLGSSSSIKGLTFENGGGYRITFGGDGYFQYHPKKASHHNQEAYWKIGNGERGMHRYEMDGNIMLAKQSK